MLEPAALAQIPVVIDPAIAQAVSVQLAVIIIGGILSILTALVTGILSILKVVRSTRSTLIAGTLAHKARGVVRDKKIQEIHLLVNSRLLTALRLLVMLTKKEAARTNEPGDVAAYNEAVKELERAEAATKIVTRAQDGDTEVEEKRADLADSQLIALIESITKRKLRRASDTTDHPDLAA